MGVAVDCQYKWIAEGGIGIDASLEPATGGGRVYSDKRLLVTRTLKPHGLRFSGEIDVTNSHAVAECLRLTGTKGGADLHLDVSALIFCDIGGIRSFVEAAENRDGGRLLLHGLPELLQTVMRVTGWADLPKLVVCSCRRAKR
jgi:anti-anti-sigma factor